MKSSEQSAEAARQATNAYIDSSINAARNAVTQYEAGQLSLDDACSAIMNGLGQASHTCQDSLCPEHCQDGVPQTWYVDWWSYPANAVHLPELFRSPSASNMNGYYSWVSRKMAYILGGNASIFNRLFE